MPSIRPFLVGVAAVLALSACGSDAPSGPSALQQHGDPAPVVEAASELVTYSTADYGDSVEVRWTGVDGDLCLETRSLTSHGFTTVDYACGFGAPEDTSGTPSIRVLSDWSTDEDDAESRLRWVGLSGQRCLEAASPSSHGFTEVTFDCSPDPVPTPSPSEG